MIHPMQTAYNKTHIESGEQRRSENLVAAAKTLSKTPTHWGVTSRSVWVIRGLFWVGWDPRRNSVKFV
jgi:hypothetical protein